MAPGRRRDAARSRAKAEAQLHPGDLVLAKVRGFPAWPAKIGRPEDRGLVPDPKKYFVEFFGTSEIAFVAPADIQLFTNESKSKLLTRSQGKTIKNFAHAVEEICEAFEKFRHQNSVQFGEAMHRNARGPVSSSTVGPADHKNLVDCETTEVKHKILDRNGSCNNELLSNELPVLEHCPRGSEGADLEAASCGTDFPVLSVQKRNKALHNGRQVGKAEVFAPKISTTSFKDEAFICHPVCIVQDGLEVPLDAKPIERKGSVSSKSKQLCDSELNVREGSTAVALSSNLKGEVVQKATNIGCGMIMLVPERKTEVVLALEAPKKYITPEQMKDAINVDCIKFPKKCKFVETSKRNPACCIGGKSYEKHLEFKGTIRKNRRLDSLGKSKKSSCGKDISHKGSDIVKQDICEGYSIELSVPCGEFTRKEFHSRMDNCCQEGTEELPEAKRSRCGNKGCHAKRGPRNCEFSHSTVSYKKFVKSERFLCVKAEDLLATKSETHNNASQSLDNELLLPLRKRRHTGTEPVATSIITTKSAVETSEKMDCTKGDMLNSDCKRSFLIPVNSRRKLCRFDCDGNGEHRTPVHRGSFCPLMSENSEALVSVDKSHLHSANHIDSSSNANNVIVEQLSSTRSIRSSSDKTLTGNDGDDSLSSNSRKIKEKEAENLLRIHSPLKIRNEEYPRYSSKLHAPTLSSPKASEDKEDALKVPMEKTIKSKLKISGATLLEKVKTCSLKHSSPASKSVSRSCNHVSARENKLSFSLMEREVKLPSKLEMTVAPENRANINLSAQCKNEVILPKERLAAAKENNGASLLMDTEYMDSSKSLKYLINAAEAKRRQVNLQSQSSDNLMSDSFSNLRTIHERSCSPLSAIHPFLPRISVEKDIKGSYAPSSCSLFIPAKELPLECEKYKSSNNPGCQPTDVSFGDSMSADAARDTLKGMMETLSRTKESIRRTTRYAINCAKYGIAGEVIELLMQKLEGEPSHHHRVDLLFLLDSIVQCSYSQKGSNEASYISFVKAALPRLLRAAAPPGSSARENRRQCLKVLRLWIERKIFPESLLRRYIDDIEASSDHMTGRNFVGHPSQIERSIDDPLREMEGILIDEYGSNATFQFPGIFLSTIFKDEKDLPRSPCNKIGNISPAEAESALEEPVTSVVPPTDRHYSMLEGVDGELEMEDVSLRSKDDKGIHWCSSMKPESCHQISRNLNSVSNDLTELHLLTDAENLLANTNSHIADITTLITISYTQENQSLQIVEYDEIQRYDNSAAVSDPLMKQAADYVITGSHKTQYTSKIFEYRSKDGCATPRTSRCHRQFRSGSASFKKRPHHSLSHVRRPPGHSLPTGNTSSKHMGQQDMAHVSSTYTLPSRPIGRRQYATTEQRTLHSGCTGPKNQNRALRFGGRTSSQMAPFVDDGVNLPWISRWKPNARDRWRPVKRHYEL